MTTRTVTLAVILTVALAVAGAVLVTGCSDPAAGARGSAAGAPGSAAACAQYGTNAIRRHVTVTTIPVACRGLSQVEVNVAVGQALRAAAAGVRGRAGQRRVIARDSRYLAGLVRAAVGASQPPAPAPVTASAPVVASAPATASALGWAALVSWLVTVGLGVSMMARWVTRPGRVRGGSTSRLNYTHFGLALAGLLTWAGYLASGVTALAWVACGLLLPTAGLGMALVFLTPVFLTPVFLAPARSAVAARRPGALVVAAHVTAASVTILLVVLAAVGSG